VATSESPATDHVVVGAVKTAGLLGLAVVLVIVLLLAFLLYAGFHLLGRVASDAASLLAPGVRGARCAADLSHRADQLIAANPRMSRCAAYAAAIDAATASLSGTCPSPAGGRPASESPPYAAYLEKMGCPPGGSA